MADIVSLTGGYSKMPMPSREDGVERICGDVLWIACKVQRKLPASGRAVEKGISSV